MISHVCSKCNHSMFNIFKVVIGKHSLSYYYCINCGHMEDIYTHLSDSTEKKECDLCGTNCDSYWVKGPTVYGNFSCVCELCYQDLGIPVNNFNQKNFIFNELT